jgi:hypothetical protein
VSASSISQAANDPQLQARVLATAQKELVYNTNLQSTVYGQQMLQGQYVNVMPLMWPLAADQEVQYENALKAGKGAPGHDADIITDAAILSGVISFWPKDPPATTPAVAPAAISVPAEAPVDE